MRNFSGTLPFLQTLILKATQLRRRIPSVPELLPPLSRFL